MPNWEHVLAEITAANGNIDQIRRKYLSKLGELTGRNIITYYSGFLQRPGILQCTITDIDKNGFMNAIYELDYSKGLDLLVHSPGGEIAATESIIHYLKSKFTHQGQTDIRVIVPQIAMSGGTLLACMAHTIVMGRQSNLGPIDPQFGHYSAHGIIEEFKRAYREIKKDPAYYHVWKHILQQYPPTFLQKCEQAIKWSREIAQESLEKNMFSNDSQKTQKAKRIARYLSNYREHKAHDRHIHIEQCIREGLNIEKLEDHQKLQDAVLTVHHCYMYYFDNFKALKIIENHKGKAWVRFGKG